MFQMIVLNTEYKSTQRWIWTSIQYNPLDSISTVGEEKLRKQDIPPQSQRTFPLNVSGVTAVEATQLQNSTGAP